MLWYLLPRPGPSEAHGLCHSVLHAEEPKSPPSGSGARGVADSVIMREAGGGDPSLSQCPLCTPLPCPHWTDGNQNRNVSSSVAHPVSLTFALTQLCCVKTVSQEEFFNGLNATRVKVSCDCRGNRGAMQLGPGVAGDSGERGGQGCPESDW